MTCDCLEAGVNVLVTKPWAVNEAEARRMIAAAEASGRRLLPWLPSRWGCVYLRLKQLIEEKAIGNVFLARRSVCSFNTRNDWQMDRRHGGGYLLNWGPHIVDPAVLALGSPVKSVYAQMRQTINPGDAEDVFLALMTLASGAIVQVEYTIACENLPEWFIQGDRGTIVVQGQDIKVSKREPAVPADPTQAFKTPTPPGEVIEEHVDGALYGDEVAIYAEIADALQGGDPYPVSTQDALELTRVFDAIRAASESNCVVDLG